MIKLLVMLTKNLNVLMTPLNKNKRGHFSPCPLALTPKQVQRRIKNKLSV